MSLNSQIWNPLSCDGESYGAYLCSPVLQIGLRNPAERYGLTSRKVHIKEQAMGYASRSKPTMIVILQCARVLLLILGSSSAHVCITSPTEMPQVEEQVAYKASNKSQFGERGFTLVGAAKSIKVSAQSHCDSSHGSSICST